MHPECLTQLHSSSHPDQAIKAEHWPETEKVHKWQTSNERRFFKDYRQFSPFGRFEQSTSATLSYESFPARESMNLYKYFDDDHYHPLHSSSVAGH